MTWTFNPIVPAAWEASKCRVLLLGAEPNGGQRRPDKRDMGMWFSEAQQASSWSNIPFFRASLLQLHGARTAAPVPLAKGVPSLDRIAAQQLAHLRYADIKALEGGGRASARQVRTWFEENADQVLAFWTAPRGHPTAPHVTVVHGAPGWQTACTRGSPR